jgi:transposase InsO family protein
VLDRHGLVERRGRRRHRAQGTTLSLGQRPNELWCTDYKGEFLLGNHQYCYPLTVTDHASRFLLTCEALSSTREDYAFTVFERLFKDRGLPANMRSDNGVPFASAHALFNLSKLAVWWLRLGIGIERIKPGHPQQNGRHERMHLTLKKEATKLAAYAEKHNSWRSACCTVEGWFRTLFQDPSAQSTALRERAMPLIAQDPSRVPDHIFGGPELPVNDDVRSRFFGEY